MTKIDALAAACGAAAGVYMVISIIKRGWGWK